MDPLTHSLAGGLISDVKHMSRKRFWIFCFLGEAPDLDVVFGLLGSWAFLLQHRGLTHSFVGVALQAFLYAWVLSRWDKEDSLGRRAALYSLPLLLHVLCDYLTSYGVPIFSPFSLVSYQADITTSVTLIPLLVMIIGYGLIRLWSDKKDRIVKMMVGGWILFVLLSVGLKMAAGRIVMPEGKKTVVPTLWNPFEWSAVIETPDAYRCYPISLLQTPKERFFYAVSYPESIPMVETSRQDPLVQRFFLEERWPTTRVTETPEGWHVDWGSMLFSTRGFVRGKVRVVMSKEGTILRSERLFEFWSPQVKHAA